MNHQELYDRIHAICRECLLGLPLHVEPASIDNAVFIKSNIYAGTMDRLVREFSDTKEGISFVDGELFVY